MEEKRPEASRAFVERVNKATEEAGGRVVLANGMIVAMIVYDERASKSDNATSLLVVTKYTKRQAGQIALDKRTEQDSELFTESIRTYTARPWRRVDSRVARTLTSSLGLL